MQLERMAVVVAILSTLALAGCAADRSRDARSADMVQAERGVSTEADEALTQKEAVPIAEQRNERAANQAEAAVGTREGNAKEVGEADKEAAKVRAAMQSERTLTEADARARFQKAEARAAEAKNKSAKIPDGRRAKFNTLYTSFATKKQEVQTSVANLPRSSNEEWNAMRNRVEKSLEDLANLADRLHEDM